MKDKLRKLTNKLKNLVEYKYDNYICDVSSDIYKNPKRFWSAFRYKTKFRTLPMTLKGLGEEAVSPVDKANLFNRYFHSVFNQGVFPPVSPDNANNDNAHLNSIQISISGVRDVLLGLDVTKAVGPDSLSPRVLRECADILSPSLCGIFNKSLSSGILPSGFKEANIISIHKKEDKESVTNYRPVSLLSCASKVMERCVLNKFYPILKNQIYYLQHGFIKGRSCTTQMVYVLHDLGKVLDCSGQIDVLYLDFSKAFDSVPHNLLLYRLNQYGINRSLLNWFSSYLMGRRQRVVIESSSFDWLPVVSGVPQGFYSLELSDFCSEYCPIRRTRRASKGPLYNLPSFKTETFANSYFNRIVPLWNNLSIELRQCSSLSTFKRLLKSHYLSLFNDQFTSCNTCSWITKCRCDNCRPKFSSLI